MVTKITKKVIKKNNKTDVMFRSKNDKLSYKLFIYLFVKSSGLALIYSKWIIIT